MRARGFLFLAMAVGALACNPVDRSVRAWIESRAPDGSIIAGAFVDIDGAPAGMTDARGIYRVKIRRRVGEKVALHVYETDSDGQQTGSWIGAFTVNTAGAPAETRGGRMTATLAAAPR